MFNVVKRSPCVGGVFLNAGQGILAFRVYRFSETSSLLKSSYIGGSGTARGFNNSPAELLAKVHFGERQTGERRERQLYNLHGGPGSKRGKIGIPFVLRVVTHSQIVRCYAQGVLYLV